MLLLVFSTSQGDGTVQPPAPAVEDVRSKGGFDPYYYKRRKKKATPLPEEVEQHEEPPLPATAREPVGIQPITLPLGANAMAPLVIGQAAAEYEARRAYELAEQDDEDVLLLAA